MLKLISDRLYTRNINIKKNCESVLPFFCNKKVCFNSEYIGVRFLKTIFFSRVIFFPATHACSFYVERTATRDKSDLRGNRSDVRELYTLYSDE